MSGQIAAWLAAAVLVCWCVGAYNRLVRLRAQAVCALAEAAEALAARHRRIEGRLAAARSGEGGGGGEVGGDRGCNRNGDRNGDGAGDTDAVAAREAVDAALRQSRAAAEDALRRPSDKSLSSLALAERVLDGALAQWLPAAGDDDASALASEGAWHAARGRHNAAAAAYEEAAREFPTRIVARAFGFGPAGRL